MSTEGGNVGRRRERRLGNMSALVRLMRPLEIAVPDPVMRRRQLVADLCRLVGESVGAGRAKRSTVPFNGALPRRQDQTLQHLLRGDSEKQVAQKLSLSKHTVHVYVKALYRRYGVSSRAELLARHLNQ